MTLNTAPPAAGNRDAGGATGSRRQVLVVVALVFGILALIGGAYALGSRSNHHTTLVLNGTAVVGDHVASIRVGNGPWDYGVGSTVRWFDSQGTEHDDSWPSCLPDGHTVPVRFGAVVVELPDGGKVRDVVWIDCAR